MSSLAVVGLTCGAAMLAHADDSTFLLQLGSFKTEAEATQQWDTLKSKNGDLLNGLTLHVAEVALPPDNTVSYRTQAGPISSHDQAASLCSNLQSRGADCYVVETALFTAPAITANAIPAVSAAASASMGTTAAATATPAASSAAPAPLASLSASTDVTPLPLPPDVTIAAPEPAASAPALATTSMPTPSAAVSVAAAEPVLPPPVVVEPPPPVGAIAAPAPAPTQLMAESSASSIALTPPVVNEPAPTPPPIPSTITESVPAPEIAPPSVQSQMAPETMQGTEVAPGVTLITPPSRTPPVQPAATESSEPGFFDRLFGSSTPTPAPQPAPAASAQENAVGNVNVAEAIRVPLGSGVTRAPATLPPVHGLGGFPSQPTQRTLWAQLSFFADENQARNFYDDFHAQYPQFSDGVRARITRPYAADSRAGHISLRVGPFEGTQDINTICIAAVRKGLRCTVVKDMGSSATGEAASSRTSYHGQFEDRSPAAGPDTRPLMYWAQLGSYHSPREAWDEWATLQEDHEKLLGRVRAIVTNPPMSSSAAPVFRLRAGPFVSSTSANTICSGLQGSTTGCLVINDR